jgi:hypothetical protein
MFRQLLASAAAVSLLAVPAAAAPAPRVPAPVEDAEGLVGNPLIPILIGLVVVAVIAYIIIDDDKDEEPVSV